MADPPRLCQRFDHALAAVAAWLGAGAGRYGLPSVSASELLIGIGSAFVTTGGPANASPATRRAGVCKLGALLSLVTLPLDGRTRGPCLRDMLP
jgi:hypothetical protein